MASITDSFESKDPSLSMSRSVYTTQDTEAGLIANPNGENLEAQVAEPELERKFNLLSVIGFIAVYMATWEYILVSLSVGFKNGGFGGLFWVFCGTVLCFGSVVVSLAELASMSPTSGGQYHWVAEFAPERCRKFCSYAAGWMSSLGWLSAVSGAVFVCTTLLEAIAQVKNPAYHIPDWQYTLIMLGLLALTVAFNTVWAKAMPMVETVSLFGHLAGFLITVVPIWVMAPKTSPSDVFLEIVNSAGWPNVGISCLVSQVTVLYCILGSDSAVHMADEIQDASLNVPRAMWWCYCMNITMGFVTLITMLFHIGPLDTILHSPAPYLFLFKQTGSSVVVYLLMSVLLTLIFAGNIGALASTSRELWAFSRDGGFPFSKWIAKVNPKTHIPEHAVYLTAGVAALLCLIKLVSEFAFNTILSLFLLALLSCYMLSLSCLVLRRLSSTPLPPARWSLGRFGLPINIFAIAYCAFAVVWCCVPGGLPITVTSANWAPAVWVVVVLGAMVMYLGWGRKEGGYTAPDARGDE